MAVKYRTAAGNWSNTAQWNGGTLPGPSDDCYTNGFAVSIDQNITVNRISGGDNLGAGVSGGGYFYINPGAHSLASVTVVCPTIIADSGTTSYTIYVYGTGAVNIIGNIYGGAQNGIFGIYSDLSSSLTITGNVYGGVGGFQSYCLYLNNSPNVTINGNALGMIGSGVLINHPSVVLTINGNVTASSAVYGVIFNHYGSVTINGLVKSGGGAVAGYEGVYNPYPNATLKIANCECSIAGKFPIYGYFKMMRSGTPTLQVLMEDDLQDTFILPSGIPNVLPDEVDVRLGVNYNAGSRTGTLAVPPKGSVGLGVPTDDGVGTAIFDFDQWLDQLLASSHPMAERLRTVSTVETTAIEIQNALNA